MSDPEEYYYTFQTLANLFDKNVMARPLKVRVVNASSQALALETATFADANRVLVAYWQAGTDDTPGPTTDLLADLEITLGRANIERIIGLDTLSAAGQELTWSQAQGVLRVAGVRICHAPNILVVRLTV